MKYMSKSNQSNNDKRVNNLKPFKKGTSGNPKGRPKGSKTRAKIIEEILNVKVSNENKFVQVLASEFPEIIESSGLTVAELLMIRLVREGLMGKHPVGAIKELLDRLDGRAPLATDPDKHKPVNDDMEAVTILRLPHNKRDSTEEE